jgi:hypothetical protein
MAFPEEDASAIYVYGFGCQAVSTDSWSGTWDQDPCDNGCFYEPGMLGACVPCCDEDNCDCFHNSVTITELGDGTMNMTITTTHVPETVYIVPHTGTAGYTATVNISGQVYDITKNDDHVQFQERLPGGQPACIYGLTRNPSTTSYWKLALLISGVSVGAITLLVFFCCNPFKRCKKAKATQGLEPTPYKPLPSAPTEHAGINYTGGGYNDL